MEISSHDQKVRDDYLQRAKCAPFLDAVFLIHYYSAHQLRWGAGPKPPAIEPGEVFDEMNMQRYREALSLVWRMWNDSTQVGLAFFGYSDAKHSYEEEMVLFVERNPGFSDRSYSLAAQAALIDLR